MKRVGGTIPLTEASCLSRDGMLPTDDETRYCQVEGCTKKLSIYNRHKSRCFVHDTEFEMCETPNCTIEAIGGRGICWDCRDRGIRERRASR